MTKKNVAIYGLTAEHQDEADKAKKEWEIKYEIIGTQDVSLAKHLADQSLFAPVVSEHSNKKAYPNGMIQPALAFIRSSDRAVIFSWVCIPNRSNIGGATYRPKPLEVWQAVAPKLQAPKSELPVSAEKMSMDGIWHTVRRLLCCKL
ncbi:Calcium-dependent protein kinase 4 [Durusdinium trenchii]|uniref:Calcium-dependent protein kinase 4 n=1 Tax=Durusdinium trenchii TaxID=1381693 RepID=A0ABP0H7H6_9DINO